VRFGGILRTTVAASAVLAAIAAIAGLIVGRAEVGVGLAIGLVIGSFNGHALVALLDRHVPFVGASLVRMAIFSAGGIMLALIVGATPWAVLLGVAGAQMVMVAAAVRQGLRA
jgi:hypothetical protein